MTGRTPAPPGAAARADAFSRDAAAAVRLLALDVDGVLTDGSIVLDDTGREIKRFHIRDGLGLRIWQKLGLHVAVITGRSGGAIQHRLAELGVPDLVHSCADKCAALDQLATRFGVTLEQTAFVGDDWPDLAVMQRVGYPIAVADAAEPVRTAAAFITKARGGRGAVREAIEHLLESKGLLEKALDLYREPAPGSTSPAGPMPR